MAKTLPRKLPIQRRRLTSRLGAWCSLCNGCKHASRSMDILRCTNTCGYSSEIRYRARRFCSTRRHSACLQSLGTLVMSLVLDCSWSLVPSAMFLFCSIWFTFLFASSNGRLKIGGSQHRSADAENAECRGRIHLNGDKLHLELPLNDPQACTHVKETFVASKRFDNWLLLLWVDQVPWLRGVHSRVRQGSGKSGQSIRRAAISTCECYPL